MKIIKRFFLTILILILVGFIFRGWIYRQLITYKTIGLRKNYLAKDSNLIDLINANDDEKYDTNIKGFIQLALSTTSKQLNFTTDNNETDPNKLITSKTAHCVGYASFFATTCNYLLSKHNLADTWIAKPQIGELYFLGINIHKYFNSPFLKDHDFVTIENTKTGEAFAVDPTINDYLCINFVTHIK